MTTFLSSAPTPLLTNISTNTITTSTTNSPSLSSPFSCLSRTFSVKLPVQLFHLPDIIFSVMQTFMALDDYHFLMNTSKKEFATIKRNTVYLNLTPIASVNFIKDPDFRRIVLNTITNPRKQITLRFPYRCPVPFPKDLPAHKFFCGLGNNFQIDHFMNVECVYGLTYQPQIEKFPLLPNLKKAYLSYFNGLTDVTALSHLNTLQLTSCSSLKDITLLRDIPELMINKCPNIEDFSVLGKQVRLTLASCQALHNVTNLSKVKYLTLESCENVVDISPLRGVYELNLFYCGQLNDLSSLGNHHKLQIIECAYEMIGYEIAFKNVKHAWLNHCNIQDISFLKNALSVYLVKCDELSDVSPLAHVKRVTIVNCKNITDITSLQTVKKLYLGPLPSLQQYDGLTNQFTLSLTSMDDNITKYDFLLKVPKFYLYNSLTFQNIINNQQTNLLKNLQLLHLQNCKHIVNCYGLGHIPTLYLIQLENLENISELGSGGNGGNRYVKIVLCSKVTDVTSLANVTRVTIVKCANVKNYEVLSKVPRLKITLIEKN